MSETVSDVIQLAGCVIRDDKGRVLLLHRQTEKVEQWELPGGKVDPGEVPKDTAVRELAEELGIEVQIVRSLGAASFAFDERHFHYEWFEASIDGGTPDVKEPHLFSEFAYLDPEVLESNSIPMSPNSMNLLESGLLKKPA